MVPFSAFVSHWAAAAEHMPHAEATAIRRAALDRLAERWRAGRGDAPLCFRDLCERIEGAISPR